MAVIRNLIVRIGADINGLQGGLGASSKELKSAQKDFDKAIKPIEQGFNNLKKAAGVAVLAVGAGLVKMAVDYGKMSDELITNSNKTGISVERLQELAYASRFVDVEVETMTDSMVKLTRTMSSARDGSKDSDEAFKKLGVSYKNNVTGELLDSKTVWLNTIDALGAVKNETERDAISLKLFGKSAQELNPLIVAGSKELNKYADEAHKVGAVLSDDAIKAGGKFDDTMQRLEATMKGIIGKVGAELAPSFEKLADKLAETDFTPIIKGVDFLVKNGDTVVKVAIGLGAAMVGWKAGVIIATVADAFIKLNAAMKAAAAAQSAYNVTLGVTNGMLSITLGSALALAAIGVITIGVALWGVDEANKAVNELNESLGKLGSTQDKSLQAMYDAKAKLQKEGKSTAYIDDIIKSVIKSGVTEEKSNNFLGDIGQNILSFISGGRIPNSAEKRIPAFATGALAYGPTLAMVGDNTNAKNNPEVIAPLSDLKDIMSNFSGNQNITINVDGMTFARVTQTTSQRYRKMNGNPRLRMV